MIHTAAYTGLGVTNTTAALSTTSDQYLARYSTTQFVLTQPMAVIAAYATVPVNTFLRAQIVAPSLLRVGYPNIRPLDVVASGAGAPANPNVANWLDAPVGLKPAEGLSAQATAGATTGRAFVVLWLADKLEPVPNGDGFPIEYTSSTTGVANDWTALTVTYVGGTLPEGYYAVVGFEHYCTAGIAARLVFPGSPTKPGTVAQTAVNNRTHRMFYEGKMGVMGKFHTSAMPSVEVLANGGPTSHSGYLRVIRLGGASRSEAPAAGPSPSAPAPSPGRMGGMARGR